MLKMGGMRMDDAERILVGRFGGAQGLKGELRLKAFTGEPTAISRYGVLASRDGRQSFAIERLRRLTDDMVLVKIQGIDDRTAAEALTNLEVFVDRDRLPPPEDGEFYHVDLLGLSAQLADGRVLGIVQSVENYGGGDLLAIAPSGCDTILIPFTREFVPVVDVAARRLVVADGALGREESEPA